MIDRDLPLKREISENIKRLLKKKDWTQLKLSEESGISKSTLSDYINCKTLINPGNVEKLSIAFDVPKSEIDPSFKRSDLMREQEADYSLHFSPLPVYGKIACGSGVLADENIEGYEEVPKNWIKGGDHFFLRAKGDSMTNARIEDGDLLLIRKQDTFENGEIIALIVDDDAVLKRVYRTDGAIILQSENSKYPPRFIGPDSKVTIVGKLKMNLVSYE